MIDVEVREWREQDAEALQRAVVESVEHLRPWMPWAADEPHEVAWRRVWLREQVAGREAGGDLFAGFFVRGEVVGAGGLHRRIGPGGLEIGYWVHVAWTGRGVATAAAGRLVEMAFEDPAVDHVEIHHDAANVASGRIPGRLGFTLVDEHRREPQAPAELGVERVWRLERGALTPAPAGPRARLRSP
ncbi:MAG TPA: GNAT family N-acetyltransferase [Baekduia sp.]|nr:GNAT family N-acetyltransferase [Baekduia sp.]